MEYEIEELEEGLLSEERTLICSTLTHEDTTENVFIAEAQFPLPNGQQSIWFVNAISEDHLAKFKATLDHHIEKLQGKEIVTTEEDLLTNPFQRIMMMAEGDMNVHKVSYNKHETDEALHQLIIVGQGNQVNVNQPEVQSFTLVWSSHIINDMPEEEHAEHSVPPIIKEMANHFRREYQGEETNL